MQRSLSQTAKSVAVVSSSSPPSGALGGDEPTNLGEAATDVAVLAPLQLKVLECLEGELFWIIGSFSTATATMSKFVLYCRPGLPQCRVMSGCAINVKAI